MYEEKKILKKKSTLGDLMQTVVDYNPTLADLVLELTPEEKEALGLEDKGESDER